MSRMYIIFGIVIILSVFVAFGLYLPFISMMGHGGGCPFSSTPGFCEQPIAHLAHWQGAFAAMVLELLVFAASALVSLTVHPSAFVRSSKWKDFRTDFSLRPTLLQELYSCGILNRRAP